MFDPRTGGVWSRADGKENTGELVSPVLKVLDYRKRWLVRPPGDVKRGLPLNRCVSY